MTTYEELEFAGDRSTHLRPMFADELLSQFTERLHGHVIRLRDGRLARCGGPAICKGCQAEANVLKAIQAHEASE